MGKELMNSSNFCQQLGATLVRNFKLKIRDSRKTIAEVFLPLYTLGTLIVLKILIPNPNFPAITEPRGAATLFEHFQHHKAHTIAVLPQQNSSTTIPFLSEVNELWMSNRRHQPGIHPIKWMVYETPEELLAAYWRDPSKMPLALIFHSDDPLFGPLRYEIRTNPSFFVTPSTTELYSSLVTCRQSDSYWSAVIPIETGDSCPVNQYYYSGFVALQTLLDYTKIRIVTQNEELQIPHITLEMFPKEAYTGNWMVAFRLVIPIYMVMALSQFITYLLILIVGEKENHIKEGLKIMGLRDSVFCFSVILIGFMITPFFDNSRTAGILGNFAVNIMSLLYFLQVFIDDTHTSAALWTVSLISPTGFALAMDKILVLDISGQGVTLHNLWTGPGIPIGGSILMLVVDILLYAALAFYFDCVIPSDHGTKQRPCFCFNRNYWCKKKVPKVPLLNGESANSFNNALEDQARDVEPVSREMRGKEAIRIVDLYKSFHSCRKPAVNAVNGINLTIYEGQITAILGHNGAGKSTLFNILTGLTSPTSGTIYIFGYDVRDPNDMTMIRRMTGVCPQHDILFETLTPKEHLYFFAAVRGIPPSLVDSEVKKTLRDIDLFDTAETRVKHLSGGQKRKLSVGIAIIGDPKIIILDEPTAGVDPYSRRHMWSILQNRKHGKVILLTTHFMDEADILAERKAVVSRGRLRCCGSSLFLKNKFGIGYHLTLVLDTNACETSITKLVNDHVPQAEKARRHGRELSYILPHDAVNSFVSLFDDIEKEIKTKRMMLGICSYGVSMTTLEEVFLHLETQREGEQKAGATGEGEDDEGEGEEDEEDGQAAGYPVSENLSRKVMKTRGLPRSLSLQERSNSYQSLKNDTKTLLDEQNADNKASLQDNRMQFDTIIPINGLGSDGVSQETAGSGTHPVSMGGGGVGCGQNSTVNSPQVQRIHRKKHHRSSRNGVSKSTKSVYEAQTQTHGSASAVKLNSQNRTNWMDLDDIPLYPSRWSTIGALLKLRLTILFRDIQRLYLLIILPLAFTALGLYLNSIQVLSPIMRSILLDNTTYGSNITKIAVHDNTNPAVWAHAAYLYHHHHQPKQQKRESQKHYDPIPQFLHQKHHQQQQQSKEAAHLYRRFLSELHRSANVTEDFSGNFSSLLEIAPHMAAFNVNVISWSNVSITTLYNDTTQHSLPIILNLISNTLLRVYAELSPATINSQHLLYQRAGGGRKGPAPTSNAQSTFDYQDDSADGETLDDIAFQPLPSSTSFSTTSSTSAGSAAPDRSSSDSILRIELWSHPFQQTAQPQEFNIGTFSSALFVGMIFVLIPVSLAVDMVYDREMKAKNQLRVNGLSSSLYLSAYFIVLSGLMLSEEDVMTEEQCTGEYEDEDVRNERSRMFRLTSNPQQSQQEEGPLAQPVVLVKSLRKEFSQESLCGNCCCCADDELPKKKVSVRSLSIGVDAGEVLGLLGHNGAGKTTTMKIMTGETAPTRGTVRVAGHSITINQDDAFKTLGYCPQHDALWKNVTVREHLELYARIRGVSGKDLNRLISTYLTGLHINEHANKQTQHCSGGTRRKLSYAMAMVGAPKVVLLDEPSTGMDPKSKRFLWDTILASFHGKRCAMLTTHSMEEADALCSRVGIMVKGELRCLGSTQHLKNLYGAGYTLEIKLKHIENVYSETPIESQPSSSQEQLQLDQSTDHIAPVISNCIDNRSMALRNFVTDLFPSATLEESFADRLVYSVPQQAVSSLAECFSRLEKAKTELDIEEYSFSQTTLEQVFLKFAHYDEETSSVQ
uniref:ABC transporter domain-containing protein n=1 Tax=Anopheles melas TaxID=34690 RepID=A0A182UJ49_9DIPT